ncbi:MAG TPA: hemerythrin domain-containing protein [Magnetospirillum sp.]|jgi:hemerythrin superfamily protein|nr:hemerythrin domain-containing protein [Magnetospirillum sp.]
MNVLEVLHDDHTIVERLFSDILRTSSADKARRETLFQALKEALIKHAHAEEKVFYPLLINKKPSHDMVEHGLSEHHQVEKLLSDIQKIPADSDDWFDSVESLHGKVKEHVQEEENDVFPKARQLLGEGELNQITERFMRTKERENPT